MKHFLFALALAAVSGATAQTAPATSPSNSVFDFSGIEAHYLIGDRVAFSATNTVPMIATSFCGSVIQKEQSGGEWANADTLTCSDPGLPRETRLNAARRMTLNVRLEPGVLRGVIAAVGPGRFRVVLNATDEDGDLLPEEARASPVFAVNGPPHVEPESVLEPVGLDRLPDEARALYATLSGFRAIAVGRGEGGQIVWGYGTRTRTRERAANRALAECASRAGRLATSCVLAAVDGPSSTVEPE